MKIKLPITMPPITSHHFYALPLAIMCSSEAALNWVYSEFIQLFTCRNKEDESSVIHLYNHKNDMFKYEPLEEAVIAPKRLIYGGKIIDTYKNIIDSSQYIYDFVDKHYIRSFGYSHSLIHDLLIYGYDDAKQVFNAFAYHGIKLTEFEIPYDEYISAYNSEYMADRLHITVLYRLRDNEYKLDIRKIGWYLLDYIEGINTYNRESLQEVVLYKPRFGIEVYDEINDMVRFQNKLRMHLRMPDIYCLYDHKRFMNERLTYLNEHSEIKCTDEMLGKFRDIESEAQKVAMLAMKVNQKDFNNETDIDRLLAHVAAMKEKEKAAYSKYYEYNREVFNDV